MQQFGSLISDNGLDQHGLDHVATAHWNLITPALYEAAVARGEGAIANGGALVVQTGAHTGRAPKDKFIVREADFESTIDWGAIIDKGVPHISEVTDLKQRVVRLEALVARFTGGGSGLPSSR